MYQPMRRLGDSQASPCDTQQVVKMATSTTLTIGCSQPTTCSQQPEVRALLDEVGITSG